jgi:hypothetical protein
MMPGDVLEQLLAELDDDLRRLRCSDHDDDGPFGEGFRISSRPKRPRRRRRRHSAQERAHRRKLEKIRRRTASGRRAITLRRVALAIARRRGLDLARTAIAVEAEPRVELDGLLERLRNLER